MSDGEAGMAKITGINHVLLLVKDMQRNADFLVNVLGLRLKGTAQQTMNVYPGETAEPSVRRLYFFETSDGTGITCAETPGVETVQTEPVLPAYWPGSPSSGFYNKVDHLALNVGSRDELLHFQQKLRDHGIEVSEIIERATAPKFVKSIYFHSPDGLPMEIAAWDYADPAWEEARHHNYMNDPDPVAAVANAELVPPGRPVTAES